MGRRLGPMEQSALNLVETKVEKPYARDVLTRLQAILDDLGRAIALLKAYVGDDQ